MKMQCNHQKGILYSGRTRFLWCHRTIALLIAQLFFLETAVALPASTLPREDRECRESAKTAVFPAATSSLSLRSRLLERSLVEDEDGIPLSDSVAIVRELVSGRQVTRGGLTFLPVRPRWEGTELIPRSYFTDFVLPEVGEIHVELDRAALERILLASDLVHDPEMRFREWIALMRNIPRELARDVEVIVEFDKDIAYPYSFRIPWEGLSDAAKAKAAEYLAMRVYNTANADGSRALYIADDDPELFSAFENALEERVNFHLPESEDPEQTQGRFLEKYANSNRPVTLNGISAFEGDLWREGYEPYVQLFEEQHRHQGVTLGVDCGGTNTKIRLAVDGRIIWEASIPTDKTSPESFIAHINRIFAEAQKRAEREGRKLNAANLSIAGPAFKEIFLLTNYGPQFQPLEVLKLINHEIAQLQGRYGLDVPVESHNDAFTALAAELVLNPDAAMLTQNGIGYYGGTGTGYQEWRRGSAVLGANEAHKIAFPNSEYSDEMHAAGDVELFTSALFVVPRAQALGLEIKEAKEVAELAYQGDERALQVWREVAENLVHDAAERTRTLRQRDVRRHFVLLGGGLFQGETGKLVARFAQKAWIDHYGRELGAMRFVSGVAGEQYAGAEGAAQLASARWQRWQAAERRRVKWLKQGEIEHYFYRDPDGQVSAHVHVDRRSEERTMLGITLPTGNAGVMLGLSNAALGGPVKTVLTDFDSVTGDQRGIVCEVPGTSASEIIFGPLAAGSMRDIRNLTRAPFDPLALGEMKAGGSYIFGKPDIPGEDELKEDEPVTVSIRVETQGGEHVHLLQLTFPPGTKVEPGTGTLHVKAGAGEILSFDYPALRVTSPDGKPVTFTLQATADFEPLTLLDKREIFKQGVFDFAERLTGKLQKAFAIAIDTAEFLVHPEAFLAGSNQFLTYFGRDTIWWARIYVRAIFILISSGEFPDTPILKRKVIQLALVSVLQRVNENGEVAHEEDLRRPRRDAGRFDYRMVDDDFMLARLFKEYCELADPGDIEKLLEDSRNCRALARNFNLVLTATLPYSNQSDEPDDVAFRHLVGLKSDTDPTGNWADSLNGLGRGNYAYDVNAIWVPQALSAIASVLKDDGVRSALAAEPAVQQEELESLGTVLQDDEGAIVKKALRDWEGVGDRFFLVKLDVKEWQERLRRFYEWLEGHDAARARVLLKETVGSDADGGPVTAKDFVYHGKVPVWCESGLQYYARALDKEGNRIEAPHTDQAFVLFNKDLPYEETRKLMQPFFVPYSLGGLAMQGVGIVVGNPMLADPDIKEPVLTDSEQEIAQQGGQPLPEHFLWTLTDGVEYHWSVCWGWVVAVFEIGLMRQIAHLRDRAPPNHVKVVYSALEHVREGVEETIELQNQEVVSFEIEDDRLVPIPLGSGKLSQAIISNPYQLWNTAEIAVQMVLVHIRSLMEADGIGQIDTAADLMAAVFQIDEAFAVAADEGMPFPPATLPVGSAGSEADRALAVAIYAGDSAQELRTKAVWLMRQAVGGDMAAHIREVLFKVWIQSGTPINWSQLELQVPGEKLALLKWAFFLLQLSEELKKLEVEHMAESGRLRKPQRGLPAPPARGLMQRLSEQL